MQYGSSHDRVFQIDVDSKRGAKQRFLSAVVITSTALLAIVLWLTLPGAPAGSVQAQQSSATPTPEQRPERGSGEGTGRRPGGRSGNADGGNRLAQSDGSSPDAPIGQTQATADGGEIEGGEIGAVDEALSPAIAQSSGIIAIAGVDGAGLTDRPQGETLYTVPMGTTLQVAGRTDDSKWLYVFRDAVIKGGKEVAPALASWTAKADVIAFSLENLPVLDAETTPLVLPEPGPNDGQQSEEKDADGPASSIDGATSYVDDVVESVVEQDLQQVAEPSDADGKATMTVTGVVNLVDSRLNLRAGPGTSTAIAGKLQPSQSVTVLGRSEDAEWLLVSDGLSSDSAGWAAADFIDVNVDLKTLPVESAPMISAASSMSAVAPVAAELTGVSPANPAMAGNASSGSDDVIVIQPSPGATFYAYNLADGALWPLTSGFDPAISPDGRTVAFTRDGGENGIYLIDIDGSNERQIFAERGRLASPKWSPTGDWIVFSRGNTFAECYRMGPACLTATQIREQRPNIDLSRLELVREPRYHLARVDANGDNYTDIAALDTARAPDWIDAGIVYQSGPGLQITDVSADAENRRVIDDYLKPYFHDPDWQPGVGPGGGRIAYMGKEGSHWEIFTVNPDGSGVTALTRPSTTLKGVLPSNVAPTWSPDGSRIAFLSNRADGGGSDVWRLWIMDADGDNQRPLDIDLALDYTFGDEQAVGW